jgi:hypothetical protein
MDLWLRKGLVIIVSCLVLALVGILTICRCRTQKFNLEDNVNNQDVVGSAENFLIGWSERRNKNGRNAESGKVLKINKIVNIGTEQEETYESFTFKEEGSKTDKEILKENKTTLLLEPYNDLSSDVMKDIVITDNMEVKKAGTFKTFLKSFN